MSSSSIPLKTVGLICGILVALSGIAGGWTTLSGRMTATETRVEAHLKSSAESDERAYQKMESLEGKIETLQQTTARVEARVELLIDNMGEDHANSDEGGCFDGAAAGPAVHTVRVP